MYSGILKRYKKYPALLILKLSLLSYSAGAQDTTASVNLYFEKNSFQLNANESKILALFIDSLKNSHIPITGLKITGNCDNTGTPDYNKTLAFKRAEQVKNYILSSGLPGIEIFALHSNGEDNAWYSNETEEGRRMNRRVDVDVTFIVQAVTITAQAEIPAGNLEDLYEIIKTPVQEFCIDMSRDTFLVGKKGAIVHYKANTINKTRTSCPCFTIRLNEYYDNSDLVLNNLTTTSGGQLLESGGMIRLEGFCNGEKYELKENEYLTVMVPADTILPGMKLLSANRENNTEYLDWKLDKTKLDDFDYERMKLACGGVKGLMAGKCPFFFCRIRNIFRSRKYKNNLDNKVNNLSEKEMQILKNYDLKGEELAVAMEKSKDSSGLKTLKYYTYKNFNWDYRNIDRIRPGMKFVNYIVENKPDKETDVKIVFKDLRTVVPCFEKSSVYLFKEVYDNQPVWVIGLKFTIDKLIYLGMFESNTADKKSKLDFKKVTIDELRDVLKIINKPR
jgi:hypothetical protein